MSSLRISQQRSAIGAPGASAENARTGAGDEGASFAVALGAAGAAPTQGQSAMPFGSDAGTAFNGAPAPRKRSDAAVKPGDGAATLAALGAFAISGNSPAVVPQAAASPVVTAPNAAPQVSAPPVAATPGVASAISAPPVALPAVGQTSAGPAASGVVSPAPAPLSSATPAIGATVMGMPITAQAQSAAVSGTLAAPTGAAVVAAPVRLVQTASVSATDGLPSIPTPTNLRPVPTQGTKAAVAAGAPTAPSDLVTGTLSDPAAGAPASPPAQPTAPVVVSAQQAPAALSGNDVAAGSLATPLVPATTDGGAPAPSPQPAAPLTPAHADAPVLSTLSASPFPLAVTGIVQTADANAFADMRGRDRGAASAGTASDPGDAAAALGSGGGAGAATTLAAVSDAAPESLPDSGTATISDQVAGHLVRLVTSGSGEMVMRLRPPELGDVTVRVAVSGRDVSAWFVSPQPQVQNAISAALGQLQTGLGNAGYNLSAAWVGADASGTQQQAGGQPVPVPNRNPAMTPAVALSSAVVPRPAASGLNIYV